MILTFDILEQGKSSNGGWSAAQLRLFGLKYPLKHGWKRQIVGKDFPDANIEKFLDLRDQHIGRKKFKYADRFVCKFCGRSQNEPDDINGQFEYALANDDEKERIRNDAPFE